MGIKTVKFGGSSLADAAQIKKVAAIIRSDPDRRYVIPSAPGKRFSDDTKVTDMLYACYEKSAGGGDFSDIFGKIKERYNEIIRELELNLNLEKEYAIIEGCLLGRAAGRDYAASRGEYLNGIILAEYLGYEFVDASEVIFFGNNSELLLRKTVDALRERLTGIERAVIPGFYGINSNGTIRTFSRGGSDITGSIVARAVKAELYENWTDVSGFLVADPRIVHDPEVIAKITYRELRELSYMGATVLHEDAIFPVREVGIPINIRNTNIPEAPGTMIIPENDTPSPHIITGIAGKKGFSVIMIEKAMMNSETGFGRRVLQVLERRGLLFEHFPTGIDTMSVIVNTADVAGFEEDIISALYAETNADKIEIEHGLALLAVVGEGMRLTRGTAGRTFSALAHARINIRMIDQGSSELNIIIGVDEKDFENATRSIYDCFVLS